MYPEKRGGSHKMARPQQNWGLLTLLTRWASICTMPNTASPKSEPPCGRAVYTPVRATILGHPPQKTAPGGLQSHRADQESYFWVISLLGQRWQGCTVYVQKTHWPMVNVVIMNATEHLWRLINIGSGNGLVPSYSSHYLSRSWPDLCRHMVSIGQNVYCI